MTKQKSTKRALLMSALAILVCVTMLIGSTFAWFTDSVTTGSNIIKSGNLEVDLIDASGASMSGEIIEFVAKDGRAQSEILWEPGCTYKTEPVRVVNKGNLALKYKITISGITGDAKLLEVIDWTVTIDGIKTDLSTFEGKLYPETGKDISGEIVLSGHMKEEAGNDYEDLTANGISISVVATQHNAEVDSFGSDYDKDLDPETNYLFSGFDLNKTTTMSGRFGLSSDIKTSNNDDSGRYGYGYEYIIRKGADYTLDLNGKNIIHDTVNKNANNTALTYLFVANHAGTKLTLEGEGNVYCNNSEGYACAIQGKDGTLITVNGGNYKVDNGIAVWSGAGSHIVINGGSFVNAEAKTDHELIYSSGGVIDIYGGFFHNTDGNYTLNVEDRNRATGFINVYGGTYVNFNPATGGQDPNNIKVMDGYKVVSETKTNGDVWYTVIPE